LSPSLHNNKHLNSSNSVSCCELNRVIKNRLCITCFISSSSSYTHILDGDDMFQSNHFIVRSQYTYMLIL
jgi:hypothetical protein